MAKKKVSKKSGLKEKDAGKGKQGTSAAKEAELNPGAKQNIAQQSEITEKGVSHPIPVEEA